jgi:nicotinate-nucleotide pyrophosphorylase (carboxylating)
MNITEPNIDLRDVIFGNKEDEIYLAALVSEGAGLVAGTDLLKKRGEEIGVKYLSLLKEGARVGPETVIAKFTGRPKQIAVGEDILIGCIAKYSGVASAAEKMVRLSNKRTRLVCGAWKKMPHEIRELLRSAVAVGGLKTRIVDEPFIYLDKNYVRMFGGIKETLQAVSKIGDKLKVIQLRGETAAIAEEALAAAMGGAHILMVDTGRIDDVRAAVNVLQHEGKRGLVKIAFAGGIGFSEMPALADEDIDILDIGRTVIDAPLLDIRLDVLGPIAGARETN